MTTRWLDWRDHSAGPARPCRICARPAICRDANGKPCHKVCAENQPDNGTPELQNRPDALVVDLAAYRVTRPARRSA